MPEAIINLAALRQNARRVRGLAPHSAVMAVIKANAYGHGLLPVADALQGEVEGFAVARFEEALTLRQHGVEQRILMLSARPQLDQLHQCADHNIDIVIHDADTARLIVGNPLSRPVRVWLKVDSGMHRLGVPAPELNQLYALLSRSEAIGEIVLMSHFASAELLDDSTTARQLAAFEQACNGIAAPVSLANSAAVIAHPDCHRDWVRPGIMLYGVNPLGMGDDTPLDAVMTLRSTLLAVRSIAAGAGVGYNHQWTSPGPSRIGTVAIGYGDGYPRHACNGTPVLVNGRRCPLVGRVSMDTITVDLSDQPQAQAGDEVILWGEHLAVAEVAANADTIAYQLLTAVSARVAYRYVDSAVGEEK